MKINKLVEGRYHHLMLMIPDDAMLKRIPFVMSSCRDDKGIVLRELLMFMALRKLFYNLFNQSTPQDIQQKFKKFNQIGGAMQGLREGKIITLEGRVLHQCFITKNGSKTVV